MKKYNIIYGTGKYGEILYNFFNNIGTKIDFFSRTEVKNDKFYLNVPILSVEQFGILEGEKYVFISIADKRVSRQIKNSLKEKKMDGVHIFECGNFIQENMLYIQPYEKGRKYCCICSSEVDRFLDNGTKDEFFEHHTVIGGGYRKNVICPSCGCLDRNRWVYWVLKKHTEIFTEKCSVLHIAPEKSIREHIQSNENCDYYSGDIEPGKAMHVVDITNIQFKENFFDYIVINHVLEHIPDEEKAIQELKRVLKEDGKIIMSVPICIDMNTYENKNIRTKKERLREFGQEDHIRLYGKDYKERFEEYGLKLDVMSPEKICDEDDIEKYGYIKNDIVMICRKG